ncbi:MAG: hypothetical protein PHV29_03205 [Candidatus Pacebacteria bacterium]|nr:hypothetical protein [Candidatus Paceibacterota bacterium]MDD2757576.1 hypothetical protein [Candidatus Paceibacterota bacterium]MDD4738282.1 hypothetical protein [Candidatus Paceibacterota bacterium]
MIQRIFCMREDEVEGVLNRIVENINEEGLVIESFRDSWEVYKKETFLGQEYGRKVYLVIEKDVINEIVCICRNDILTKVIRELKVLSMRKRIGLKVKIKKEIT